MDVYRLVLAFGFSVENNPTLHKVLGFSDFAPGWLP